MKIIISEVRMKKRVRLNLEPATEKGYLCAISMDPILCG